MASDLEVHSTGNGVLSNGFHETQDVIDGGTAAAAGAGARITFERSLSPPSEDDENENSRADKKGLFKRAFSKEGLVKSLSRGGSLSKSKSKGLYKSLSKGMQRYSDNGESDAANSAIDEEGELQKRRMQASETARTYKAPALIQIPVGVRYSIDLLAIFHNGMRNEMTNVFHMLALMERCGQKLTHEHIQSFGSYFEVVWDYIADYFEVEERVLFLELEEKRLVPNPELFEAPRRLSKLNIVLSGNELRRKIRWCFPELTPTEAFDLLRTEIISATTLLTDYLLLTEKLIPGYIDSVLDSDEIIEIEKRMMNALQVFAKRKWANMHIPIRWQTNSDAYQQIASRHFSGIRMFEFKKFQKEYELQHESILKEMHRFVQSTTL